MHYLSAMPWILSLVILLLVMRANKGLKKEIAGRKRAEKEARAAQERFRVIADYTYGLEFWHDETGKLRWVNPSVKRCWDTPGKSAWPCRIFPNRCLISKISKKERRSGKKSWPESPAAMSF